MATAKKFGSMNFSGSDLYDVKIKSLSGRLLGDKELDPRSGLIFSKIGSIKNLEKSCPDSLQKYSKY